MPKKKKAKKEIILEGVPIEDLEYHAKKMEGLQKHAVQVGEELNAMRQDRTDLEKDRDNMVHYYGNAIYQLMKVEREIRRAERHLIHTQGMGEDEVGKNLINIEPYVKLNKEREGYVLYALDRFRGVFKAEREITGDRLRARKEAWEQVLDGEVALMKVRHRARTQEMGKISETYTTAILGAEREAEESEQRLFDRLEEANDREFRRLLLVKNKQVHDMRQSHEKKVEDMRSAYGELKYSQHTLGYREEAIKLTGETTHFANLLAEYKEFYIKYKRVRDSAEKQALDLLEVEAKQGTLEAIIQEKKGRYKKLEECANNLMLEINLLEDYHDIDEEILKTLWKDCFTEVKKTRLKHMRICHAMDTLRQQLQKELEENTELLNLYYGQRNYKVAELWKMYDRRLTLKDTISELADRALKEQSLYVGNLDPLSTFCTNETGDRRAKRTAARPRDLAKVAVGKMVQPRPSWDARKFGIYISPAVVRKKRERMSAP